jgi:hypothetical protein
MRRIAVDGDDDHMVDRRSLLLSISGVALVALAFGFAALMYSAMLGFGVNEWCTSQAGCATSVCPPCDRLSTMAVTHAAAQALLAAVATGTVVVTRRRSWASMALPIAVGTWAIVAAVLTVEYTDAAWAWARSR